MSLVDPKGHDFSLKDKSAYKKWYKSKSASGTEHLCKERRPSYHETGWNSPGRHLRDSLQWTSLTGAYLIQAFWKIQNTFGFQFISVSL